jgi:hypothetical protein
LSETIFSISGRALAHAGAGTTGAGGRAGVLVNVVYARAEGTRLIEGLMEAGTIVPASVRYSVRPCGQRARLLRPYVGRAERRDAVTNLTADGHSTREIGEILGVSNATVSGDVTNVTPIDAVAALAADDAVQNCGATCWARRLRVCEM